MTLPEVLVDHKLHGLAEPWTMALPLDHDALVEADGERHELPAGAVLVWTGEGDGLDWYPASHPVRTLVLQGVAFLLMEPGPHEGGARLWPNVIDELFRLVAEAGLTPKLGLRAQGHVQTIAIMILDGEDWPTIGKAIGWCPETARRHWGWLCECPPP